MFYFYFISGQPKVFLAFGPSYVEKNKNITLPVCQVISFPPAVITRSKVLGKLAHARAVPKNRELLIMNAQKTDSGLYKCKASNELGYDSAATQLNVVELPHFTVSPPAKLESFTIQNVTVPCQADPEPQVTWMRRNGELPVGRTKVSVDGTLQIWNTKEEDSRK